MRPNPSMKRRRGRPKSVRIRNEMDWREGQISHPSCGIYREEGHNPKFHLKIYYNFPIGTYLMPWGPRGSSWPLTSSPQSISGGDRSSGTMCENLSQAHIWSRISGPAMSLVVISQARHNSLYIHASAAPPQLYSLAQSKSSKNCSHTTWTLLLDLSTKMFPPNILNIQNWTYCCTVCSSVSAVIGA